MKDPIAQQLIAAGFLAFCVMAGFGLMIYLIAKGAC